MRILFLCTFLCGFLMASGLASAAVPVRVTASSALLGDLVQRLGGDAVTVRALAGPGSNPHAYQPGPREVAAAREGAVWAFVGHGFDPWFEALAEEAGREEWALFEWLHPEIPHEHVHGHACEHGHGVDAHFWMDPLQVAALAVRWEEHTGHPPAEGFAEEMQALHDWIAEAVATVPVDKRLIVSEHAAWEHFARAYGFETLTLESGEAHGTTVSARQVAALARTLRERGIPAIFLTEEHGHALLQTVADESGARLVRVRLGNLGPVGSGAETYPLMLRQTVKRLVEALGGTAP